MKRKILSTLLSLSLVAMMATACSQGKEDNKGEDTTKETIKLGIRATSIEQAEVAKKTLKEQGYELDIVTFDDNIAPNVALAEGSIDANMYQHGPYLDSYNASKGTDFVMIEPKISTPLFGLYSEKFTDYKDIPNGATLGLCNDATNQVRGLTLLDDIGLVNLPDDLEQPTIYDVQNNKEINTKGFKFIEAEMTNLPQSISDVDGIILAGLHMVNAGKDATKYLATANDKDIYAVGVVVQKKDKEEKWVKDLNNAFRTEEMRKYMETSTQGTTIPLF